MDNNANNRQQYAAQNPHTYHDRAPQQHPQHQRPAQPQMPRNPNVQNHPQRPQPPQHKKAPTPSPQPVKKPSVLFTTFAALALIAVIIIVVQVFRKPGDDNIMGLFGTQPTEYDTSAAASVQNGQQGGLMAYPTRTENTKHLNINSSNGMLINLRNNTIVAEKNGSEKIYPASMTKILTLIVAYENVENLDDTFTFDFDIVNDAYIAGASVAGFKTGETVTIRDLLYGTVLPSGADATTALAQYVAGDEETFAALMNKKAAEIGMKDSHFVTASGLHDNDHYSTCQDMALALKYAIATPYLREILGTYTYTTTATPEHPEGIMLFSTMYTKMKGDEAEGIYVQGGKTGYTPEAHNCLASFAAKCTKEDADDTAPQYILVTGGGIGEYAAIWDAIDAYEKYT